MIVETIKFLIYAVLIVLISKYLLANTIRKLALNLKLSAKTVGNISGFSTSVPELLTISISTSKGLVRC